jgi:hypothetical protein
MSQALTDAIQAYHDLLTDELAAETQWQLDDQLQRRGLFFGPRPLCTVLRPRFMTPEQYRYLRREVQTLMRAFDKAYHAAIDDTEFRRQFGLADWEEELIQIDPGFGAPSPTGRLDAFFMTDTDGLRFIEYNAEVPAAPAYNDALSDVFLGLPVMREFLRRYEVRPLPARHGVMHVLLDAYHQWLGRREAPRIAILDWREVPTYSEFVLFEEYFRSQGLETVIADPRELEYRDGKLLAGDFHITLIYKRVLISELIQHGGLDQPVVRAIRDRAVCMVNSFRCKILHKKLSLGVLSDERNAGLFSTDELQVIEQHIPWTRRVEERRTWYHGRPVDLVPFIVEDRASLVLKPNDEYGGKGVILGWQTDPEEWARAVQAALGDFWIVQERVPVPREPFPSLISGTVQYAERILDTDPFVSNGSFVEGCLTRISTADLVNVTAGGGSSVPTFVVEDR